MRGPTVAIVGRPNVGKSSLFNRLLRRRQALVDPTPGVTRDRLEAALTWRGRTFRIVDTGGLLFDRRAERAEAIHRQTEQAIREADLLLLVCEVVEGLVPLDHEVAEMLRKSGKPVLIVANKADTQTLADRAVEFHLFGFGSAIPVSSSHGRGIGELLDAVVSSLPRETADPSAGAPPAGATMAIVGRPNVGKSTLVNHLFGQERVTVDSSPGTTRDAIEVLITSGSRTYQVVDTAGIRARPKLKTLVDIVSVKRSFDAIERADVCLLLLDVSAGILTDDLKLLGRVLEARRPCVVLMNKWDLIEAGTPERYAEAFRQRAPFAAFLPVLATSTKTGYHVREAFQMASDVADRARRPVPREALKKALAQLRVAADRPGRLGRVRLVQLRQKAVRPVIFELTVHGRIKLHQSDLAFIERIIRARLHLIGIPVRIVIRVV